MVDRLVSVDDGTGRLPQIVRERLAEELADPESEIGASQSATIDAAITVLRADDSADHSAMLNAALNAPGPKTVQLIGTFRVSGDAVSCFTDDTVIDAERATFNLLTSGNILRLGRVTAQRAVTASMTAGSSVVSAAPGTFTSADVGRSLVVPGAGPESTSGATELGAYRTNLTGVVASVAGDGSTATLAGVTADIAVASVSAGVHLRTRRLKVLGGRFNRGALQGANNSAHSLLVRRVDGLDMDGQMFYSTAGKYSIFLGDVTDFRITGTGGNVASDGVHGIGPLKGGAITGINFEYTGDDTVALGNSDYITYADIAGSIRDVRIEVDSTVTHGRAVLLFNASSNVHKMTGVSIGRVRGESTNTHLIVINGDTKPAIGIEYVTVTDVDGRTPSGSTALLSITGTVGDIVYERLRQQNINAYVIATRGDASSDVRSIRGRSITVPDGYATRVFNIDNGTVVPILTLDDFKGVLATTGVLVNLSGDVDQLSLANIRTTGGTGAGGLIMVNAAAVGPVDVYLDRIDTDNYVIRHSSIVAAVTLYLGSVLARSAGVNPFRTFAAATLNVFGGPVRALNATMISYTSSGSGRVNGPTLGVDVSKIVGKLAGDEVINLNASLACGAGPVITDGTSWKHKFTGASYTPA